MKHLVICLFITLTVYFAWQYAPKRPKTIVKRFFGKHFMIVAAVVTGLIAGLFTQTINNATKII